MESTTDTLCFEFYSCQNCGRNHKNLESLENCDCDKNISTGHGIKWLPPITSLLLQLLTEQKDAFKNHKLRNSIFKMISRKMIEKGFNFSDKEVKKKYSNMMIRYKKIQDSRARTGKCTTTWEYFDLMDELNWRQTAAPPKKLLTDSLRQCKRNLEQSMLHTKHTKINVIGEDGPCPLLSLDWNNHQASILENMLHLYKTENYSDVTIACDGNFYPAHKFVLSACSEYFKKIFSYTETKHPIVVLTEFTQENIRMLLQYMYLGEVKVNKLKLPSLLKSAKFLGIKGLFDINYEEITNKRKLAEENSPSKRRNIESTGTCVTIPVQNTPIRTIPVQNTPIRTIPVINTSIMTIPVSNCPHQQRLAAELTTNATSLLERIKGIEHESVKNEDYDLDLNEYLSNTKLKPPHFVLIDESNKEVKLDSVKMENDKLSNPNLGPSQSVFIGENDVKTEFYDDENVEIVQEDPFIEKDDVHMQEQRNKEAKLDSVKMENDKLSNPNLEPRHYVFIDEQFDETESDENNPSVAKCSREPYYVKR